jgi:uncharacterized protein
MMHRPIVLRPTVEFAAEGSDPRYFIPDDPNLLLESDPTRRVPVTFTSAGLRLAGHLYRPQAASNDRTPALVMAGPFSSVKEQTVPHYAERLADAGYTVLTFDPRSFGESEGTPQWHHDPAWIIEDLVAAVDCLRDRRDVEAERIGAVGVCMGGGYVISAAARDKRIKAVASVAGGYDIGGTFQRLMGVEAFAAFYRRINDAVENQRRTGEVVYMPTIAHGLSNDTPFAAMPNHEAYSYYDRTAKDHAPNWSYQMTVASLEPYFSYNALAHVSLIAPAPLLLVHGTRDLFLLPEYAQAAYDAAIGPKQLVWISTHNHIELYDQNPYVSQAVEALIPWLDRHLAA